MKKFILAACFCATCAIAAEPERDDYWRGYSLDITGPTQKQLQRGIQDYCPQHICFRLLAQDHEIKYRLSRGKTPIHGYGERCVIFVVATGKETWMRTWAACAKDGWKIEYSETGPRPTPLPPPAPPTLKEAQKLVTASRQQEGPDRLKEGWEKRYSKFLKLWKEIATKLGVLSAPPAEDEEPGPC